MDEITKLLDAMDSQYRVGDSEIRDADISRLIAALRRALEWIPDMDEDYMEDAERDILKILKGEK